MDKSKQYLLGMYEKSLPADLSWQDKLEQCRNAGFDWLEISIDETEEKLKRLDWNKQERRKLKELTILNDVPLLTMCLSGHRRYPLGASDPQMQQKSLQILEKAIDLAVDLGIRIIQLAGYDVYYQTSTETTRRNFVQNLNTAVQMAARKGVVLGFETMETPFMDTVEKAMEYVRLINSPYLGVYPDLGNLTNASLLYQTEVKADLEKGKGHIWAVHLKETRPGIYREVPFGTGHTEYVQNLWQLKRLGIRMFTGEFWYTPQFPDYPQVCREACSFLRSRLDTVFYD